VFSEIPSCAVNYWKAAHEERRDDTQSHGLTFDFFLAIDGIGAQEPERLATINALE
jgi:hypothetical protein